MNLLLHRNNRNPKRARKATVLNSASMATQRTGGLLEEGKIPRYGLGLFRNSPGHRAGEPDPHRAQITPSVEEIKFKFRKTGAARVLREAQQRGKPDEERTRPATDSHKYATEHRIDLANPHRHATEH